MRKTIGTIICATGLALFQTAVAQADPRVALVIGNSGYKGLAPAPFATADATAISETLRAAGYQVTDVRDLTQADSGRIMREFLDKVAEGGAETDAFFYFSGYGAQVASENYLIPVDATIRAEGDVANEAFRLNDFLNELAQAQARTKIVVVDAARDHKIPNIVPGLAVTEVPSGMLVGFSSAPMASSNEGDGPYSLYAASLVTQMRDPNLEIADVFKTTRMNVNKATNAAQIPWSVSALAVQFYMFGTEETIDKNAQTASIRPSNRIRSKQDLSALPVDEAYQAAIELDTLKAYQWFVELYPKDPRAAEIWEIIAKRREALLWRRSVSRNTKTGYWNYMKRYPQSPYMREARERLVFIGAPPEPPIDYIPLPEPLPEAYVDEAVGVPEIFVEGIAPLFAAFEPDPPIFLPPPVILVRPPLGFIRPPIFGPVPFMNKAGLMSSGIRRLPPSFNNLRNPQNNIMKTHIGRTTGIAKTGLGIPKSNFAGTRGPTGGMSGIGGTRGPTGGMSGMSGLKAGGNLPPVPTGRTGAVSGRPIGGQGALTSHGPAGQNLMGTRTGRPTFGPGSRSAMGGRNALGGRTAMGGRNVGGRTAMGGRNFGGRTAMGGRNFGGRSAYSNRSFNRSAARSFNRPVSRSYNRPVARSFNRPVARSFNRPVARSFNRPVARSFSRPVTRSFSRPAPVRSFSRPVSRPTPTFRRR